VIFHLSCMQQPTTTGINFENALQIGDSKVCSFRKTASK